MFSFCSNFGLGIEQMSFRLRHVNNSVYVDRCVDKLSLFAECLSGFRLCRVNNSVYVDRCLDKLSVLVSTEKT